VSPKNDEGGEDDNAPTSNQALEEAYQGWKNLMV
jgi:hypothetical protein